MIAPRNEEPSQMMGFNRLACQRLDFVQAGFMPGSIPWPNRPGYRRRLPIQRRFATAHR